jgi:hypothetical protein
MLLLSFPHQTHLSCEWLDVIVFELCEIYMYGSRLVFCYDG